MNTSLKRLLVTGSVLIIGLTIFFAARMPASDISGAQVSMPAYDAAQLHQGSTVWSQYVKPADAVIRTMLSSVAYAVTQNDATETPFSSQYAESTEAGIYVDAVSGEPLFSSSDKYDSGTGWPSFVQPLRPDAVTYHTDNELGIGRTEVRSRYADSHLGHVFDDGPVNRGGKRYCMNGVALRFVPKDRMAEEGYGDYISSVAKER